MHRYVVIPLLLFGAACLGTAQMKTLTSDVLGAHLNYGRGCSVCHSPHSGSSANADGVSGAVSLWGGYSGTTMLVSGDEIVKTPDVAGMLICLGCHDGNYAPSAMMKNQVYETMPSTYGVANEIPTLMGTGEAGGVYLDDHPMGLSAQIRCGGASWDCAETRGEIRMTGAKSRQFVSNYGFFIKPGAYNNSAVVVCTTCHDPHSMNVVAVKSGSNSGLPPGTYATMLFLRAPYNTNDTNPVSNLAAQFCRQCHADKSNEMNGSSARTAF